MSHSTFLRTGVVLMLALLAAPGCLAQTSRPTFLYDMGRQEGQALQNGYTAVGPGDVYDAAKGYGWHHKNSGDRAMDRHDPEVPFYHTQDTFPLYNLVRDGVTIVGDNQFIVDMPNGAYEVMLYVGDASPNEYRPNLFVTVNGRTVLEDAATGGGQVLGIGFPVEVSDGRMQFYFDGRGHQKYFPVNGIEIRSLDKARPFSVTTVLYPQNPPTTADYAANWRRYVSELRSDWQTAKSELKSEGVWQDVWALRRAVLKSAPGYHAFITSNTVPVDRLAEKAGGALDLNDFIAVLKDIGVDGLSGSSAALASAFPRAGMLLVGVGPGLEQMSPEVKSPTWLKIVKPNGTYQEITGAYSVYDPATVDMFKRTYAGQKDFAGIVPFIWMDEPRGAWFSGGIGDYSEPAKRAFRKWAAANGYPDLAESGPPAPARSWDFYRFYRFRLSATPDMVDRFWKLLDIPVRIVPGNGDLGPETVNHNTIWPPATARARMGVASWCGGNKAAAELLRATEVEFGGYGYPFGSLNQSPTADAFSTYIVITANCDFGTSVWHQGTYLESPRRVEWMKSVHKMARLAQATSGLVHQTNVYLYCPESLVYNDLVADGGASEADRWVQTWRALQDANVDFKVTVKMGLPTDSILVYAPRRAVLNREEADALAAYLARGGTIVYASETEPELPDGSPLISLRKKLASPGAGKVVRTGSKLDAQAVISQAEGREVVKNPRARNAQVRTYSYKRPRGGRVLLWLNAGDTVVRETVAFAGRDVFSGKAIAAGSVVEISPLGYRMVEE